MIYQPYLKTLRRLPDAVVLAVATREINTSDDVEAGHTCLCGWAYREWLAGVTGLPAEDITWVAKPDGATTQRSERLAEAFGGSSAEWARLYLGICRSPGRVIEEAFARRVAECVP